MTNDTLGLGRRPLFAAGAKPYHVRLQPATAEYLKLICGSGSLSVGIERLFSAEQSRVREAGRARLPGAPVGRSVAAQQSPAPIYIDELGNVVQVTSAAADADDWDK